MLIASVWGTAWVQRVSGVEADTAATCLEGTPTPKATPGSDATPETITTWSVERVQETDRIRIVVSEALTGDVIFNEVFLHRIELAASTVSPSHRFVVYVQGNNVASEVTILDAAKRESRTILLSHGAELAPFAIEIDLCEDESVVTILMERFGGSGPECWIVDLSSAVAVRSDCS